MNRTCSAYTGFCRLCRQSDELLSSHIIPNFFFKHLKRENDGQVIYIHIEDKTGELRKAQESWQEYLLCAKCEAILEKYETYMSQVLYFPGMVQVDIVNTKEKRLFKGIDPQKIKLFQLSVLWRASISSLPIFNKIVLPHEMNEFLRGILLSESMCLIDQYWCDISTYYDKARLLKESAHVILQPTFEVHRGRVYYLFVFGGYVWKYFITNAFPSLSHVKIFRDENTLLVRKYPFHKIPVIYDTLTNAARMGLLNPKLLKKKR